MHSLHHRILILSISLSMSSPLYAEQFDKQEAIKVITERPNRPKLAVLQMIGKYGEPQLVSAEKIVWYNPGPYKRIMVTKEEIPHDFPLPHMDFLEHTIEFNVPQDKVGDLIEFDGSSTINRTAGELSARCDLEGHNILTLNLDNDIITGKKSVKEARKAFGELVAEDVMGKHPAYVEALQFKPMDSTARFADEHIIPGSPIRAVNLDPEMKARLNDDYTKTEMQDAEVLASIIAVDSNEVLAASVAEGKKVSSEVLAFAKMLHTQHGENQVKTMKLAEKLDIKPLDTEAVDQIKVKGAGELAALVPLDGENFEKAYIMAMVKGHEEVIGMIDNKLTKMTEDEKVKVQLNETRGHVAAHLAEAKRLQKG